MDKEIIKEIIIPEKRIVVKYRKEQLLEEKGILEEQIKFRMERIKEIDIILNEFA